MSEYENTNSGNDALQSEGLQQKFILINPVNFDSKEDLLGNESFFNMI